MVSNMLFKWQSNSSMKNLYSNVISEKKKSTSQNLLYIVLRFYYGQLRHGFSQIKKENQQVKLRKQALNLLSRTTLGKKKLAFDKWKTQAVQIREQTKDLSKPALFVSMLRKLLSRSLKKGFDPLKDIAQEAVQLKRKYLLRLIYVTQNKQKTLFDIWSKNAKSMTHLETCRTTLDLMEVLKGVLKVNLQRVLVVDTSGPKKASIIR